VVCFRLSQWLTWRLTIKRNASHWNIKLFAKIQPWYFVGLIWTRRKWYCKASHNLSTCCWRCSTWNAWQAQWHTRQYTHPFPERFSGIVIAKTICVSIQQTYSRKCFTVSSSRQLSLPVVIIRSMMMKPFWHRKPHVLSQTVSSTAH